MQRLSLHASLLVLVGACATSSKPTQSMVYASSAMNAAERSQSEKYSPDLFRRAENAFWKAKQHYLTKDYQLARKFSKITRRLAERAELDAELKTRQSSF